MPVFNNSDTINNMQRNGILLTSDETPVPINSDSYSYLTVNSSNVDAEIGDVVAYDNSVGRYKKHFNLFNAEPGHNSYQEDTFYYKYKINGVIYGAFITNATSSKIVVGFMIKDGIYTQSNTITLPYAVTGVKYGTPSSNISLSKLTLGIIALENTFLNLVENSRASISIVNQSLETGELTVMNTTVLSVLSSHSGYRGISYIDLSMNYFNNKFIFTSCVSFNTSEQYSTDNWNVDHIIDTIIDNTPSGRKITVSINGDIESIEVFEDKRINRGWNFISNNPLQSTIIDGSINPALKGKIISYGAYDFIIPSSVMSYFYIGKIYDLETNTSIEFVRGYDTDNNHYGILSSGSLIYIGDDNGHIQFMTHKVSRLYMVYRYNEGGYYYKYEASFTIYNLNLNTNIVSNLLNESSSYIMYRRSNPSDTITGIYLTNIQELSVSNGGIFIETYAPGVYENTTITRNYIYYKVSYNNAVKSSYSGNSTKFYSFNDATVELQPASSPYLGLKSYSSTLQFFKYDGFIEFSPFSIDTMIYNLTVFIIENTVICGDFSTGLISIFDIDFINELLEPAVPYQENTSTPVGVYEKEISTTSYIKRNGLLDISETGLVQKNFAEIITNSPSKYEIIWCHLSNDDGSKFGVIITGTTIRGIYRTDDGQITISSTSSTITGTYGYNSDVVIHVNTLESQGFCHVVNMSVSGNTVTLTTYKLTRSGELIYVSRGSKSHPQISSSTVDLSKSGKDLAINTIAYKYYAPGWTIEKTYTVYAQCVGWKYSNETQYRIQCPYMYYDADTLIVTSTENYYWYPVYASEGDYFVDATSKSYKKRIEEYGIISSTSSGGVYNRNSTIIYSTGAGTAYIGGWQAYSVDASSSSPRWVRAWSTYIDGVGIAKNLGDRTVFDSPINEKVLYYVDLLGQEIFASHSSAYAISRKIIATGILNTTEPSIYSYYLNSSKFAVACGDWVRLISTTNSSYRTFSSVVSERRHSSTDGFMHYYSIGPLPMYGSTTQVRIYPQRPYPFLGDEYITLPHQADVSALPRPIIQDIGDGMFLISRYTDGKVITETYDKDLNKLIILDPNEKPVQPLIPGENCYSVNGNMVSTSNLPSVGSFPLIGTAITNLKINLEIENNKQ